ncbi:hypothetical protein P7K49_027976, partial [Saguinus oedipus]
SGSCEDQKFAVCLPCHKHQFLDFFPILQNQNAQEQSLGSECLRSIHVVQE